MVGGRDVRVCAHHKAAKPVHVPTHRDFLRGCLGMYFQDDCLRPLRLQILHILHGCMERTVRMGLHELASQDGHDT